MTEIDVIEHLKAEERKRVDEARAGIAGKHLGSIRMVPDPSMTDAEFLHRMSVEMERANETNSKPRHDLHKVSASENAMTRIGALCFIRRRQKHHEQAAEIFKSTYEARYGSAMSAMDASRVQVDNSPIAHDGGMASKIDSTNRIVVVEKHFGKERFNRLVAVVVLGVPCGEALHWRTRRSMIDVLLDDLDELAMMWGLTRCAE